jgi:hypothetical protein
MYLLTRIRANVCLSRCVSESRPDCHVLCELRVGDEDEVEHGEWFPRLPGVTHWRGRAVGLRVNIASARHVANRTIQLEASYWTFDWCSRRFRPETDTKPNVHYFIRLQTISFRSRTKAATWRCP